VVVFSIDTEKVVGRVSPMIYGQMVEHAYWSEHLGLCAQMIDNRGFESDRDGVYDDVAQGWKVVSTDRNNRSWHGWIQRDHQCKFLAEDHGRELRVWRD
jgi:hypothetical protein